MRKYLPLIVIVIPLVCCLCAVLVYFLPPVHDRLAWRIDELLLRIRYTLNPPGEVVFVPQGQITPTLAASSEASPTIPLPTPAPTVTATASPAITPTLGSVIMTIDPLLTPTITPTPLPDRVDLKGVRYEDQHGRWNYCAPSNLSMALSFWGWRGNRDTVGPLLKPNDKDKNVMPYEMVDYVETQTDLHVVSRVGGDLDLLRRFLAAGYPVLVEKGTYLRDLTGVVSWMGHFQVITGYDHTGSYFITQDSFIKPDYIESYDEMLKGWRAFNYLYIVIYSADKEAEVMSLLGPDADETTNFQNAALKASNEVLGLSGIDQYFAWFNRGTNLVELQDYANAAAAYDESFKIFPTLPETDRPWRMLWYQTGPYWAYFYSERYYDTLYLADSTLNAMQGDKNLEESYYWRGMARAALGDTAEAIEDYRACLTYHPGFEPALYQLRLLGIENP